MKNKFAVGDRLELLTPSGNYAFTLEALEDKNGNPLNEAPGSGYQVRMRLPAAADTLGLITRYMPG